LDFGKYKFEYTKKKVRDSKKKQKLLKLKEIRMQPKIDDHDLDFKSKHVRDFLAEGNKVKVTVRFRDASWPTQSSDWMSLRTS
jgi:translation initiation factor IF-3